MKQITFETVFDDYLNNPDVQTVKNVFSNHSLEEWDNGNEMSVMSYEDESRSASLNIIAHKDYGLGVLYMSSDEADMSLTEKGQSSKEIIHIGIGDGYVFRYQLVSKETAWQAVEYFMETGKRNPNLQWKDYEVPEVESAQTA